MPPVGFEPTISASKQPQTHPLDCVATGIGRMYMYITSYGAYICFNNDYT